MFLTLSDDLDGRRRLQHASAAWHDYIIILYAVRSWIPLQFVNQVQRTERLNVQLSVTEIGVDDVIDGHTFGRIAERA